MSKALLVIDMPVLCEDCPISYKNDYRDMCPIIGLYHNTANERPDWCPLIPMPENDDCCGKLKQEDMNNADKKWGWGNGWNACIDTIIECNANDEG